MVFLITNDHAKKCNDEENHLQFHNSMTNITSISTVSLVVFSTFLHSLDKMCVQFYTLMFFLTFNEDLLRHYLWMLQRLHIFHHII